MTTEQSTSSLVSTSTSDNKSELFFRVIINGIVEHKREKRRQIITQLNGYDIDMVVKIYDTIYDMFDEKVKANQNTSTISDTDRSIAELSEIIKYNSALGIVLDSLTGRWCSITSEHIKNYRLLEGFLKTTNYSHANATDEKAEKLEDFLVEMIYHFYKKEEDLYPETSVSIGTNTTPIENKNTHQQFEKLFDMIQFESVTLKTFELLSKLRIVQELSMNPEFLNKINRVASSIMERFKPKKSTRFSKTIGNNGICFCDIEEGDKLELQDGTIKMYKNV